MYLLSVCLKLPLCFEKRIQQEVIIALQVDTHVTQDKFESCKSRVRLHKESLCSDPLTEQQAAAGICAWST